MTKRKVIGTRVWNMLREMYSASEPPLELPSKLADAKGFIGKFDEHKITKNDYERIYGKHRWHQRKDVLEALSWATLLAPDFKEGPDGGEEKDNT